jgi:AcrR family transcriptional regulator
MAAGVLVDFPSMGSACYFPSLESLLRDSTSRFLAAVSAAPDPDLTNFRSLFSRVLSTYPDPPLEAVWFFSALTFHDAPDDLRSILHLLSAFTAGSRDAAKPLALLAPIVSELFHSAKPRREVEALVEAVLSYISICCSRPRPAGDEVNADAGTLLPGVGELVKVWSVRNSRDRCPFQVLFPLVGDEARRELMK